MLRRVRLRAWGDGDEGGRVTRSSTAAMRAAVPKRSNQSNAYMLVYVRKADWERVMAETGKDVMEPRTRAILEAQMAEKLEKRRSKMQAHRFVKMNVITYEQMQGHVRAAHHTLTRVSPACEVCV
jgi:hypothetical protein